MCLIINCQDLWQQAVEATGFGGSGCACVQMVVLILLISTLTVRTAERIRGFQLNMMSMIVGGVLALIAYADFYALPCHRHRNEITCHSSNNSKGMP